MKQQMHLAWLVAKRELIDQLRDWRVIMPMAILILFFPYLMNFAALRSVSFVEEFGGGLIGDRLIPFLLMVVGFFPITVSLVVALEAFVGEKERGTIEPMLSSPLADWHLYMGKLIAGSLVPLVASYVSIGIYMVGLVFQGLPFPPLDVIIQMLLLTAVQAVLMVSAAIVISTQSTSVRAANLLASFIVLPVSMLVTGESIMIFWGDNEILWSAIVGVAIVTGLIVRLGLAHFQREALIGREIDMLNLKWVLAEFWKRFSGSPALPATLRYLVALRQKTPDAPQNLAQALALDLRAIPAWYVSQIPPTLKVISRSTQIVVVLGVVAIFAAYAYLRMQLQSFPIPSEEEISWRVQRLLLENGDTIQIQPMPIFLNNLRAELLIFLLGAISFGVAAVVIYLINFALIGAVLGAVELAGLSPLAVFAVGVLPHGILELPSVILATAATLHLGVRIVTPNARVSLAEVVIETTADWFKIAFGVAIPLLFAAALIEATITPLLLRSLLAQVFLP